MPAETVVASPVLVGRDEFLALADRRLEESAAGRGRLLFVSGEAGIGKTRLLSSISRRAERLGFAIIRAAAFPGDTEATGGVLLDLAGDLRAASDPSSQVVGRALSDRFRAPLAEEGDPHRQRRLLVQDLVDALSQLDRDRRLLIVLEDLHWADQLSLEVIGRVAARLRAHATLVVGAYRSDELFPQVPMRRWRGRLVSQRVAEEIRLPRLSVTQTATLTSAVLGRPAPAHIVSAVHDRSDGIPLHVEELLAAAGDAAMAPHLAGGVQGLGVPDTLADAVLARAQALDDPVRAVAAAAAVIGRSFDFDLLTAVTQQPPESVDRCLRQLQSVYLVEAGADEVSFDFRHALIRDVLYADIALPRRRQLHERVALVGVERGYRDAFVSAHFDQADLRASAHRHALLGAREATVASAHREALGLYRRALRNLPPSTSPHDHATLLAAIGAEAAAVDDNVAAAEAYTQAHTVWTRCGDRLAAATVVPPLVAVSHLLGEALERRVRRLESSLASLDDVPDAERVKAHLLSALAAAYMLDRRLDEAISYGEQSRAVSDLARDGRPSLNTAATLGSVLLFAGEMDSGWALLEDAVARSVDSRLEAEAARSYRMIGSCASVLVEYDRAEHWLSRGISYAETVELLNHRNYLTAHLAHVEWACGTWSSAQQTAERALVDGHGGTTTQITAQYVLGYLAMGRGEWTRATELLDEALQHAEAMGELQRISPALWGLAETALLRGDHDTAVALCDRGYAASDQVADAAYLFPFLLTGTRARLARHDHDGAAQWLDQVEKALTRREIPGTLPAIEHGRGLLQLAGGKHDAARATLHRAAEAWRGRRRFWEGSWAVLDEARAAMTSKRYAEGRALAAMAATAAQHAEATTLLAAADELLHETPGSRPAQPWHPLTAREFSVARLVADGLTNRQIAERLVLSPKTVSAHIEHILSKLGAARRAEIAAWAARVGV